jgi:hypothetical protein
LDFIETLPMKPITQVQKSDGARLSYSGISCLNHKETRGPSRIGL